MRRQVLSKEVYLGRNEILRHKHLEDTARSMHVLITGSTGTGKTVCAVLPMIFHDILTKKGVIFIDPKGDSDTFNQIQRMAKLSGRPNDVIRIDLGLPEKSSNYNPLKFGNSSELKDKLVGSIVWTEEYYKKVAEKTLLYAFNELDSRGVIATIPYLSKVFNEKEDPLKATDKTTPLDKEVVRKLAQYIKTHEADLEGLKTDLYLWSQSKFSSILAGEGETAFDWLTQKKIVYIKLNTLAFEETARRFGRLVVQDVKTAAQHLQNSDSATRAACSLYIDEFASVASSGFIELLNKARSAGLQITLAHQSFGDLTAVSESFASQVIDNTNVKILFRMDAPESVDFFSKYSGTRKTFKRATQVERRGILGEFHTGKGTVSEVDEFNIPPNGFRQLKRGEAYVITKIPYSMAKVKFVPAGERLKVIDKATLTGRKSWSQRVFNALPWV